MDQIFVQIIAQEQNREKNTNLRTRQHSTRRAHIRLPYRSHTDHFHGICIVYMSYADQFSRKKNNTYAQHIKSDHQADLHTRPVPKKGVTARKKKNSISRARSKTQPKNEAENAP